MSVSSGDFEFEGRALQAKTLTIAVAARWQSV